MKPVNVDDAVRDAKLLQELETWFENRAEGSPVIPIAKRLAELAQMLREGNPDRPPAVVILRTLLRYVIQHGSTCQAAKAIAMTFDELLESGTIGLGKVQIDIAPGGRLRGLGDQTT